MSNAPAITAQDVSRWLAEAAPEVAGNEPMLRLLALGPEDNFALEPLQLALADESFPHRWLAARTLGQLRRPESVPLLAGLLDAKDWLLRAHSARSLGLCEARAPHLLERLVAGLDDPDLHVRVAAGGALLRLGTHSSRARELLVDVLRSSDWEAHYWAAEALGDAIAALPEVLADLVGALDHWNDAIIEGWGAVLAGLDVRAVVPPLLEALPGGSDATKKGVLHVLRFFGPNARVLGDAIADALFAARTFESEVAQIRVRTLVLVEVVGLERADVHSAVVRCLDDTERWVRERAAEALLVLPSTTAAERARAEAVLAEP